MGLIEGEEKVIMRREERGLTVLKVMGGIVREYMGGGDGFCLV